MTPSPQTTEFQKNWCPWWHMLLWPPYHHRLHAKRFILRGHP
jgi:hypothetical protein